jgi:hypothetical protein
MLKNRNPIIDLPCEICVPSITFPSEIRLALHYDICHDESEAKFVCQREDCSARFLTEKLSKIHFDSHGGDRSSSKTTARLLRPILVKLRCRFCDMTSHFPSQLRIHELSQHREELKHSCPKCCNIYSDGRILEAHKVSHQLESPFPCKLCPSEANISFDFGPKLQDHISTWHCFLPVETPKDDVPTRQ